MPLEVTEVDRASYYQTIDEEVARSQPGTAGLVFFALADLLASANHG